MIGAIAYLGHRIQVQNMPNPSPMLHYLQHEPRQKNMTEVIEDITVSIMEDPVKEWGRTLDQADFPHNYFGTFGAIVANLLALIFPEFITDSLVTFIA